MIYLRISPPWQRTSVPFSQIGRKLRPFPPVDAPELNLLKVVFYTAWNRPENFFFLLAHVAGKYCQQEAKMLHRSTNAFSEHHHQFNLEAKRHLYATFAKQELAFSALVTFHALIVWL
jgi:hypothetical protein